MTETRNIYDEVAGSCAAAHTLMTARRVTRAYDDALRPVGLTITQFTLLIVIGKYAPDSISELGDGLHIDRSTLSRNLMPLEKAGLVTRGAEGDRRQREIRLTPKGRAKLKKAYPLWRAAQDKIETALGPDRLKENLSFLSELRTATQARP